ncbi:ATP-binding protein [uncultured Chitinophaga sp.]|jgi:hypothetical protein|uniref:AAA family ATPase n=1 Tax=uncultured Chitinophaga sp. TaxID=339340 RepID=UPI00262F851A|nr:ATP-binding protein [uncultured Chitinophaga sp.]
MILRLEFENFRSYKAPVNLSLVAEGSKAKEQNVVLQRINKGTSEEQERILKMAAIYGANASGKSNLIRGVREILSFVCNPFIVAGQPIDAWSPFRFDINTYEKPVRFAIDFIGPDDVRFKYEISFGFNTVFAETLTYWPMGKPVVLLQREIEESSKELIHKLKYKSGRKEQQLDLFQNQAGLSKFGSDVADEFISKIFVYFRSIAVVTPLQLGASPSQRDSLGRQLVNDDVLLKRLNELLRFADTGLKSLRIATKEKEGVTYRLGNGKMEPTKRISFDISATHPMFHDGESLDQEGSLPLSEESNGVRTLFTFGGRILRTLQTGGIIFVDELETSLHPYLSKLLVLLFQSERINKKNAQIIFTTHDTNLLDRTIFRKDQIWFAEKDECGVTELYSLQDFPDVREDTPFDKWYLAGKFGGIPDIQSIESLFEDI